MVSTRKRLLVIFAASFFSLFLAAGGLEVLVEEDFSDDPGDAWSLNGSAEWDSANERAVLTPAQNGKAGSMFFLETLDINNFRLEAKAKLCCGTGADGMTITFVEDIDPTAIGHSGGGMCATGLTTGHQIVVEFDIYGNGEAAEQCADDTAGGTGANHLGVEYSATGFSGDDPTVAGTQTDRIPTSEHAENAACAGTDAIGFDLYGDYVFELVVQVQNETVTVDIGSEELGVEMHRVSTHDFIDYEGFEGLVGVTASTGGLNAEQSVSYLKLTSLPEEFCLQPPGAMERVVESEVSTFVEWEELPAYELGSPMDVTLEITSLREESPNCPVPTELTISETLPEGWEAQNISSEGTFNEEERKIIWELSGEDVKVGGYVTYEAVPGGEYKRGTRLQGTFWETGAAEAQPVGVGGTSTVPPLEDPGFESEGFITKWLVLGPFQQPPDVPAGDDPGEDIMAQDWLTDGDVSELSIMPAAGDQINPDYAGAATSWGLEPTPDNPDLNPAEIPTWLEWHSTEDTIVYDNGIYGTVDNVMNYAVCYVKNETDEPIVCDVGVSSDDSVQVILNGGSIWAYSIPRGVGDPHVVKDTAPAVLTPGVNRLMVKTFEGGGGFNMRLRFQDKAGEPITENLSVSLQPPEGCSVLPVSIPRQMFSDGSIATEGGTPVPAYVPGEDFEVELSLDNVREEGGGCSAPGNITITEYLPEGWSASNISNDGSFQDGKVTWNITAEDLATTGTLVYTATGPVPGPQVQITGTIVEEGNPLNFGVGGQSSFLAAWPFTGSGAITTWLLLGPYMHTMASPGTAPEMEMDYLTDGLDITEANVLPATGDTVETDFAVAQSTGLAQAQNPDMNPDMIPAWYKWRDGDEQIDADAIFGALDNVMCYGVCYLDVEEPMTITIGCGSDDCIGVLIDEEIVWTNAVARGWPGFADTTDPIELEAGLHRLMVKCFEFGGGWNFGCRIQDVEGDPLLEGYTVTLVPPTGPPEGIAIHTGDANGDGAPDISDAIYLLNYLLAGGPAAPCAKAADTNDDDKLDISDAISLLGYLFTGTPITAPDGSTFVKVDDPGCVEYAEEEVPDFTVPEAVPGCANPCEP